MCEVEKKTNVSREAYRDRLLRRHIHHVGCSALRSIDCDCGVGVARTCNIAGEERGKVTSSADRVCRNVGSEAIVRTFDLLLTGLIFGHTLARKGLAVLGLRGHEEGPT